MNTKKNLQKQYEQETGLTIEYVKDAKQLNDYLDRGLAALYCQVFAEAPYFEKLSVQEAKDIFQKYLANNGCIFLAFDPAKESAVPVAFSVSEPLEARPDIAAFVKNAIDPVKTIYYADTGVDPLYRQKGLSLKLKALTFEVAITAGFNKCVSRTSQKSYKQISAFNKMGGLTLSGVFNDVASTRLDGKTATDRRIFCIYNLKAPRAYDTVEPVIIRPGKNGDMAIIEAAVPAAKKERQALIDKVKATYPAISQVVFGKAGLCTDKNTVFKGRLHFAK